jgi:hypothetical protein
MDNAVICLVSWVDYIDIAAQRLSPLPNETLVNLLAGAFAPLENVLVDIQSRIKPQSDYVLQ